MAGQGSRGRRWGPIRAQTEEARELTVFLRQLIDLNSWTLRRLEEAIPYGKSTISDNLNGKVPPERFVLDVVAAVVREPRMKARDLERARALWKAADQPPKQFPVTPPQGKGGELALIQRTQDQLVEVYKHNGELERERAGSHQLVLALMRIVSHLQGEADQLQAVPQTQGRVAELQEQLRTARQELEAARLARREAELLASRAQQQTNVLQEQLAQLRTPAPGTGTGVSSDQLPPELEGDAFLTDVDQALRTAEGFLREGARRRVHLADGMELTAPDLPRQVGEGWVTVALLTGRTLGCMLMMTGAVVYYAVSTWVTSSELVLGFPAWLCLLGAALLTDPWDMLARLWPVLRGLVTGERQPFVWGFSAADLLTRALRIPWGGAAAAATVLCLATVAWWPLWFLFGTVPAALGTMAYTVMGQNSGVVNTVAPVLSSFAEGVTRGVQPTPHSR